MNSSHECRPTEADSGLPEGNRNTVQALLDQLQQQAAETLRLNAALAVRDASLLHAEAKINALTLELAHLRRIRFGAKSEALNAEQRDLFQETLAADIAACEAETEQVVPELKTAARRERAGRQPLPESLPRIEVRHEPESCACGKCGKDLVMIRQDVSEQLDVKPAEFFVLRHIRPQYACRACDTIAAATIPAAIIDGGLAAPGLLTWVVIGKYADHLPLYRLEQIAARQGVTLVSSTLADWIGRIGVALTPLAQRLAAGAFATSDRLDFGDDLFGFRFAGGDVSFQGFLEQVALFGAQRFALGAEADAAQVGEFEGERLDFGFAVLEGGVARGKCGIETEGFGGLVLQPVEQILNGVWVLLRQAGIGFDRATFRARIHAGILPDETATNPRGDWVCGVSFG